MHLLTTKQMRAAESYAINDCGVPSILLMENAARGAAEEIIALKPKNAAVLASSGNNGGDGLAVARQLESAGIKTEVFFTGELQRATLNCSTNLGILKALGITVHHVSDADEIELAGFDVVVDALIGTGLKQKLSDKYIKIVNKINEQAQFVVAIDCPTGINADNGRIQGAAVKADLTVTFHLPKCGLMLYPAYGQLGKLVVRHIGIPCSDKGTSFTLDKDDATALLPARKPNSHKGTYGRALFISGSSLMTGAAIMNARAAYKIGAGLVNVCTEPEAITALHAAVPEAVTSLRESMTELLSSSTAAAIGSGIGIGAFNTVERALKSCTCPLVIDADAINIIAEHRELFDLLKPNMILTPHLKEMSRLIGKDTASIAEDMINIAQAFADKYGVTLVLKNAHSVIAAPNREACINITGCSAMSKGGSGDTLTGAITGLLAQGLSGYDATCLGAYLCGKAGEICAKKSTQYGVTALECANAIPLAIAEVLE